jgi:RNA polymerase sigma factor (sigma-70 family)
MGVATYGCGDVGEGYLVDVTTPAKDEVFRRYGTELTRFATCLVGPHEAQDVVSEALLRCLWSSGWDEVVNQRAYLYRSVLHQARAHHRAAVRRHVREARAAIPGAVASPDGQVDVWEALAHLSIPERAVVFLTYWEDLTQVETGERLGVSERTVRRRLDRACRSLRRLLR